MRHDKAPYIILFALGVCVVCGILVSTAAVSWADAQKANKELDRQRNVLEAVGFVKPGEPVSAEEIQSMFANIQEIPYDLENQTVDPSADLSGFDVKKAISDPALSMPAPKNASAIQRIPKKLPIYEVLADDGTVETVVLPIWGLGLWSTMYGYIAIDPASNTVKGITYYEHGETPGLGGEVENPRWKALWPGRKIFTADGEVGIEVIKGSAGPPEENPYEIDGLSGSTITSRGVTNMLRFWMGDDAFGPFLKKLASEEPAHEKVATRDPANDREQEA